MVGAIQMQKIPSTESLELQKAHALSLTMEFWCGVYACVFVVGASVHACVCGVCVHVHACVCVLDRKGSRVVDRRALVVVQTSVYLTGYSIV